MIRFARPGDRPALMVLWQEAFGDSAEDTAYYFDHRHQDENLLLLEQDGTVAGMLTMLPAHLMAGGEALPIRYIYAVATATAYRRQGISTRLLEHAHGWMRDQGMAASVLAPATPDLFGFYARRGYGTAFFAEKADIVLPAPAASPNGIHVTDASVETYARVRDKAMANRRLYVRWDHEALLYVINAEKTAGSRVLHAETPGGEAVAICQRLSDDHVRVVELLTIGMDAQEVMAAIHTELKAKRYTLRLPEGSWPGAERVPLGMMLPLRKLPERNGTAPYLGLIKD